MKFLVIFAIACATYITDSSAYIEGRELCNEPNCRNECDGNNCNYCQGSNCCENVGCNRCVNECSSSCQTRSCNSECLSGCTSGSDCNTCTSCVTRGCRSRCTSDPCKTKGSSDSNKEDHQSTSYSSNNHSESLNVTTDVKIENLINNTNHIHNPVYVNSTNINNILIKRPTPSNFTNSDVEIITKEKQIEQVYIPRPYPVPQPYPVTVVKQIPVPQPYPVHHQVIQRVPFPQPYPVPHPIIQRVPQPYIQHVPVPHPIIQHVPVPFQPQCPLTNFGLQCNNYQYLGVHQSSGPYSSGCNPCFYCNGEYNPQRCMQSPNCPVVCQEHYQNRFQAHSRCNVNPQGQVVC